jgi:hypothetical protein
MRKQQLVLRGTVCPFVVSFAFKPRNELSDELRPPFKCKSPGFNCNDCVVKSQKEIENKQSRFRDLTAARHLSREDESANSLLGVLAVANTS